MGLGGDRNLEAGRSHESARTATRRRAAAACGAPFRAAGAVFHLLPPSSLSSQHTLTPLLASMTSALAPNRLVTACPPSLRPTELQSQPVSIERLESRSQKAESIIETTCAVIFLHVQSLHAERGYTLQWAHHSAPLLRPPEAGVRRVHLLPDRLKARSWVQWRTHGYTERSSTRRKT